MDEDKNQKPNLSPPPNLPSIPPSSSGRPLSPVPPIPPSLPKIPSPPPTPSPKPPGRPASDVDRPGAEVAPQRVERLSQGTKGHGQSQRNVNIGTGTLGTGTIRTMQSDIDSILKGKKPEGEAFERKTEGAIKPPLPPPPLPPAPAPKGPLVKLGETEKAKPIAPPSVPRLPGMPKPEEKKIAISPPKPGTGISIPPKKSVISKPLLLLIAVIVAAGGFSYWFLIIRQPEVSLPVAEVTPTPFESPAPIAEEKLVINLEDADLFGQLNKFLSSAFVSPGEIKVLDVEDHLGQKYNFNRFFQSFLVTLPQDVLNNLNIDNFKFLLFSQTEDFGASALDKRYGFVVEVISETDLAQGLKNWEPSMADNIGAVLNLNIAIPQTADFQDNVYKGVAIRYKNFPFPDETIDYAIITGVDGKGYFILVNSRENIFAVIDNFDNTILPLLESPPPSAPFGP